MVSKGIGSWPEVCWFKPTTRDVLFGLFFSWWHRKKREIQKCNRKGCLLIIYYSKNAYLFSFRSNLSFFFPFQVRPVPTASASLKMTWLVLKTNLNVCTWTSTKSLLCTTGIGIPANVSHNHLGESTILLKLLDNTRIYSEFVCEQTFLLVELQ